MSQTSLRALAAALMLTVVLSLAACGDDEGETTTVTETAAPTTTEPTTTSSTSTTSTSTGTGSTTTGEDVSGNCDEAEHADDPECTGGVGSGKKPEDDSSGHGSDDD